MSFQKIYQFSAILPNYNDAKCISKSIQSLIDQSEPFMEIIVVDDGSNDNSVQVIREFMQKYPQIQLLQHEKNQGVSAALNTGIKQATGDYVLLCAADDSYDPSMVAAAKKIIQKFPNVGVICGDAIVKRFDMKTPFKRTLPYKKKNDLISANEFRALAKNGYVGFNSGGGMLMNRKAVVEAGMLHSVMRWHNDWFLYFGVAMRYGVYYVDQLFIHIDMRKTSYSEGKAQWEVQKKVIKDSVYLLEKEYPDLWDSFRDAALLPHYSLYYLPLFISDPLLRKYFTMKLFWKLFINNKIIVKIGRLFPYSIILRARKLLRA